MIFGWTGFEPVNSSTGHEAHPDEDSFRFRRSLLPAAVCKRRIRVACCSAVLHLLPLALTTRTYTTPPPPTLKKGTCFWREPQRSTSWSIKPPSPCPYSSTYCVGERRPFFQAKWLLQREESVGMGGGWVVRLVGVADNTKPSTIYCCPKASSFVCI